MGAVFGMLAGLYMWLPKLLGAGGTGPEHEARGYAHFAVFFVGVNTTFLPQHFLGLGGMPRRIPDSPDAYAGWNGVSSVGSIISVAATALLVEMLAAAVLAEDDVSPNPWLMPGYLMSAVRVLHAGWTRGTGLEYAVESPTPTHAFMTLPLS
jgi:cytochrome c oxidase subunit 1